MEHISTVIREALLRAVDGEHTDEVMNSLIDRQVAKILELLENIAENTDQYHMFVAWLNNLRLKGANEWLEKGEDDS